MQQTLRGNITSIALAASDMRHPVEFFVSQTETAGPAFTQIATNSMGELLMATPALSDGVMFVRTAKSLFAIGQPPAAKR